MEQGALTPDQLLHAITLRARRACLLGQVLLTHGMITPAQLTAALREQCGRPVINLRLHRPDRALVRLIGAEFCLRHQAIPIRRTSDGVLFACARPDGFGPLRAALPPAMGRPRMALARREDIHAALQKAAPQALVRRSETRVNPRESCRAWDGGRFRLALSALAATLVVATVLAPQALITCLAVSAMAMFLLGSVVKIAAASHSLRHVRRHATAQSRPAPDPPVLPPVSILVPLFRERRIATHLIRRLRRLDYPRELLDIRLVVEADDRTTQQAILQADPPRWMRMITVPPGSVRTKPRAMNFALDFCTGEIIGVYDAEDAPDRDQLRRVARRFHECGPEVACLQGVLDYYNARTNWLSRCFTIEYATWFRVILPGLQRLGLILPLGGTTLFIRRDILEALGGWDAHNVTEDADLGIRLARHGYRTEFLETVTGEEANCRLVPWIRQRSRWLKGFAMTWAVHMRNPALLIRQVGWWRFLGLQVLLPCALGQFLLAPLMLSFWLIPLGVGHPAAGLVSPQSMGWLAGAFVCSELVMIAVAALAVSGRAHRHLLPWVPGMHFYYPLGALAAYKAMWELARCPFYWSKTSHGLCAPPPGKGGEEQGAGPEG